VGAGHEPIAGLAVQGSGACELRRAAAGGGGWVRQGSLDRPGASSMHRGEAGISRAQNPVQERAGRTAAFIVVLRAKWVP
jgi:hypothetical protein